VSDERTEPHSAGSTSGSVRDTLTISEAAAFLGVHKNTVRNRVKDGTYEAEQVLTERGPTYFIKRESILNTLTTNTLSSASQEHGTAIVSPQSFAFVQELLRPFVNELGQVREELGAERVRREMAETTLREGMAEERRRREEAERERDDLRRELHEWHRLEDTAESTAHEIHDRLADERSHEATPSEPSESPESEASPAPGETPTNAGGEAQEATERPEERSWWRRMFGGA
jgi:excisionase family DNA binding protein